MSDSNTMSENDKKNIGIKSLIDRAMEAYERLPMLEVIFEKLVSLLSTSLRNLTDTNLDISIKNITSLRFGSYINSASTPSLVVIFRAREWDSYGLLVANSTLIYTLVDLLFGGQTSNPASKIESRPYTSIEQSVLRQISELILNDVSESFSALSGVKFLFERMETDPRFASIARLGDSAVLTQISIDIDGKKGVLDILFPYDSLEPIKDLLLQVFIGEQIGVDLEWERDLREQVMEADLTLHATLQGKMYQMKDILNLKIGNTLIMENSIENDIDILVEKKKIMSGKLGQYDGKVAIMINKTIDDIINESEEL